MDILGNKELTARPSGSVTADTRREAIASVLEIPTAELSAGSSSRQRATRLNCLVRMHISECEPECLARVAAFTDSCVVLESEAFLEEGLIVRLLPESPGQAMEGHEFEVVSSCIERGCFHTEVRPFC